MNPPQVYMCSPSWTPLPRPSPSHPSGSSQCTSPTHPVSCIELGLAIRFTYDIIHVSMPFSQIIPPLPSPESKRLYYTSVSLLVSCIQGYWRRQWHPTPVLLSGESHGWRSLGQDWANSLSLFTFTFHFNALEKEMAPTPVLLPGKSHGRMSLVGCSPWGC